jgi:hypothetical protein
VDAAPGLAVVHRASGYRGRLVRVERDGIVVRTPTGGERVFRLLPGAFVVDGRPVTLVSGSPAAAPQTAQARQTASGSVPVARRPAKVAQASRILVEGVHDAELVEKVWGDDLREEGIVVERLDGIDHLADVVRAFSPGPGRALGVLVDHLVPGSKESRLADEAAHPHVLVTGTPYVDVWEAVRPVALGIDAWPVVPKGRPWKEGVCIALGVPDPPALWRRILGAVTSYADLEPPFVGAVERLIDFVTEPPR